MRVMVIVKATRNSEAGVMPTEQQLAEMGKFNEELVKAGVLLAAVEQSRKSPEAVARWTERGQGFFQQGSKRSSKARSGDPAAGSAGDDGEAATAGGGA